MSQDPYLMWAQATNFRDYGNPKDDDFVPVAIECKKGDAKHTPVQKLLAAIAASRPLKNNVYLSSLYSPQRLERNQIPSVRHITARVRRKVLRQFSKLVERMELGLAINESPKLDWSRGDLGAAPEKPVIGVIDDQFSFLHPTFLRPNTAGSLTTAFMAIWDQGGHHLPPNQGWGAAPYGGLWQRKNGATIAAYPKYMPRVSHGTLVAGLAAGDIWHGDPIFCEPVRRTTTDAAMQADLIGVQMPRATVQDTTGGAMCVHVLDAIHFILGNAMASVGNQNPPQLLARPTVINMSYGTNAGAHDGTSILESAFDELMHIRDGRLAIVMPAGNQYESRGHAHFSLESKQPEQTLNWRLQPDDASPNFLEIWPDAELASDIEITVTSPSGQLQKPKMVSKVKSQYEDASGKVIWGIFSPTPNAQSKSKRVWLLAMASTRKRYGDNNPVVEHGCWKIKISLKKGSKQRGSVHAWIERDDFVAGYRKRGRQSYFEDACYEKFGQSYLEPKDLDASYIKRSGSFNSVANGAHPFVVGAWVRKTDQVAAYSGASPAFGRKGPDCVAQGEATKNLHGIRSIGNFGTTVVRASGTSFAAPIVTRLLVHQMTASNTNGATPNLGDLKNGLLDKTNPADSRRGYPWSFGLPLPRPWP
jgi:subtilisin family serine protease